MSVNKRVMRARILKCATYARMPFGAHLVRHAFDFVDYFQSFD
jgi:hypothetical protein